MEILRSVLKQVAQPSLGAWRRDMFVMVMSSRSEWVVGFLIFIASLLGEDIEAFPTM